ncbi:MAG: hypothetical protein KBC32_08860 [Candidatus Didemnitutus sp.]|nr:hypothetical protein [Candidatus Didemnitutus sp.]
MPTPFAPLAENLPFAFAGERLEPARTLTHAAAQRLLAARNATGKPNHDVLRETIGLAPDGNERRRWIVDFPPEMSAAEAALYAAPFAALTRQQATPANPHRDPALRTALARLERFLASPAAATEPAFAWIEGDVLPDESLVVWARDDDFSAGVLASSAFTHWCSEQPDVLAALRSFPFPWPPATPLSALSRLQEEHRFALARAARAEDSNAIDDALAAAYGWPANLDDTDLHARLAALHSQRLQSR